MDDAEPSSGLPGDPDGLERLWTPHRMAYLDGQGKPSGAGPGQCPFCAAAGDHDDERALVVARGTTAFVLLNLFPYNSGHLMVLPYRHVADYTGLDAGETAELASMTQTAMVVLGEVMAPHGFNVGINQGGVAGAGITAHLHQHVVPRWGGDANFMPIVARTKVLPELLSRTRERLAAGWPKEEASC